MAEGGTITFNDPNGYAAAFGDALVNLTITGAGDFKAGLTRLKLQYLEVFRCRENLPRIAYISLPSERLMLSFPIGRESIVFGGLALRSGDIVFHGRGERVHQRSNGGCRWGLIAVSPKQLASSGKALTGWPITAPPASRALRPPRHEAMRFRLMFRHACRLAETGKILIERPEVARALEQELLHAVVNSLAGGDASNDAAAIKHRHAAILMRFEEVQTKHIEQKPDIASLCAEVGVAERTLRTCCTEFLGVSPTRYLLLQRLNRARDALRRANPRTSSVAEVARNHHFLEFGRFAVAYRNIFGESPSATLLRDPPDLPAGGA